MTQDSSSAPAFLPIAVPPLSAMAADDLVVLLNGFPGPGLIAGPGGQVQAANIRAGHLVKAVQNQISPAIEDLIKGAAAGRPGQMRAALPPDFDGNREALSFDLTVVPVKWPGRDSSLALLLARETTFERGLTAALMASRELYKDLVACSGDFAWETDRNGCFTFLSRPGALGYTPQAMTGRSAQSFTDPAFGMDDLFSTRVRIEEQETWMRAADGTMHCMILSAVPVFDEARSWIGARGVCRDVTEIRMREAELARAQEIEMAARAIVDAMRNQADPTRMFEACIDAVANATDAASVILRRTADGAFTLAAGHLDRDDPDLAQTALRLSRGDGSPDSYLDVPGARTGRFMARVTAYQGRINGALCVFRREADGRLGGHLPALIDAIAGHVGIAIAQGAQLETLQRLSRVDELTGLLNRRAFTDAAERRLAKLSGTSERPVANGRGTLLYIDLDNFKPVNDILGHALGDALLANVGRLIKARIRTDDLAARIGGDEFAVWLDEIGDDGVRAKVEQITNGIRSIAPAGLSADKPFGCSIGWVAVFGGTTETLADLMERADQAMYETKAARKGQARPRASGS